MSARTQITIDSELQRRAQARAADLRISFAEYMRRLLASDLGEREPKTDISILFDLIDEGPPTDIARDKDKMIGQAVWADYLRKTARKTRAQIPRPDKPTLSIFVVSSTALNARASEHSRCYVSAVPPSYFTCPCIAFQSNLRARPIASSSSMPV